MQVLKVKVGDKWSALECIFSGKIEKTEVATDDRGREYITNRWFVSGHKFRCVCGGEVTVAAKEFKGKRLMKDCGCGRAGFTGDHCVIAFSSNSGVKGHLDDLARFDGRNRSQIINTALREYFERRTQEQEWRDRETVVGVKRELVERDADDNDGWEYVKEKEEAPSV